MTEPDWLARYAQACAEERQQALERFASLLPQIEALGATRLVVPYNGHGDEGTVEPPVAYASDTELALPVALAKAIQAAAQLLLPSGYENNAGGFGELELDVAERKITRDHNWRIEDVECEMEEYLL